MADALMMLNNNVASSLAGGTIETRYTDLITPKQEETAEEVINRIKGKVERLSSES